MLVAVYFAIILSLLMFVFVLFFIVPLEKIIMEN